MMYDKLSPDERKERHSRVAAIIEENIKRSDYEYRDEIIYHLEGAGDGLKLFEHCLANADVFEKRI
jgi:hypothetical protein